MTVTDPRAVRSRQAMIEAAVRLLQRGGAQAVTHQAVAVEAGVGRATVYRHWTRVTDLLVDALGDSAPVVDFGEGDLRTRLLHEFTLRLTEFNSPAAVALVGVLVERGEHDARVQELRDRVFGQLVDAVCAVVAEAADAGELVADAPARELAVMMFGALLIERVLLGREVTPSHLERVLNAALTGWWRRD